MKQKVIIWLLAFLIVGIAPLINAQVCGDVSGDEAVSIIDMVRLIDWVMGSGPAPPSQELGDLDNYQGVTQADIVYLAWYFFSVSNPGPLDCNPTGSYSYATSPEDTLFVPRFIGVPADQDVVYLPILTNLRDNTKGIAVYLLHSGPGFDDVFQPTSFDVPRDEHDGYAQVHGDTIQAGFMKLSEQQNLSGLMQLMMIKFERINPGLGDIDLVPTDRSSLWRLGVVKDNYDIQIPTIVTIDFTDNILQATPTELQFESVFDFPPPAVVQNIELTDASAPINWSAVVDQDWLQIDQNYGTTPSTIQVSVDPTGLGTGVYNGIVTIIDIDFPYATPIEVPVTLTVVAPYPSMDANCDGRFNISDLTYIVAYLFGNPHGPAPCDPCTGTFPEQ